MSIARSCPSVSRRPIRYKQIPEAIGSGPFKFVASERIPGQRVVFEKNAAYVPRKDGKPSFNAGPKIVYVDRVVWNFIPDPATASAALTQKEIDWWENPQLDLVPQLRRDKDLIAHREGPHRRNRLSALQPSVPAVRQSGDPPRRRGGDGPEGDHAGALPAPIRRLIKTDVGIFVPGTPMASTVGVEHHARTEELRQAEGRSEGGGL